jgi:CDP-4-dehydro-6-deoxyglucose reductase
MSVTITIRPSGHQFQADADDTVLAAALREGYNLPYGCRNGACGSCKGRVLSGRVDYGVYQENALTELERTRGMALFCCAKPLENVEIECREVGAAKDIQIRKMPCRVQKLERPAADVLIVELRLPQSERLQYLAGQYLDIIMKDGQRRSFSMANPPHADEALQLHIRNYGGVFSQHAFERMRERDILRFEGPYGSFFLREDSDKPIILLASGTGFAPIKAIVEHALHIASKRPMALYWGGRKRSDLYLHDLAQRWSAEHGVRFVPVLSDPLPDDAWQGRTGLVHKAVMEDCADLSGFQVYACGNPLMVEAARTEFTALCGLPEGEFFCDAFTAAAEGQPAVG